MKVTEKQLRRIIREGFLSDIATGFAIRKGSDMAVDKIGKFWDEFKGKIPKSPKEAADTASDAMNIWMSSLVQKIMDKGDMDLEAANAKALEFIKKNFKDKDKGPLSMWENNMKITKRQLRRIIREAMHVGAFAVDFMNPARENIPEYLSLAVQLGLQVTTNTSRVLTVQGPQDALIEFGAILEEMEGGPNIRGGAGFDEQGLINAMRPVGD